MANEQLNVHPMQANQDQASLFLLHATKNN